jgi:hypothetical protein
MSGRRGRWAGPAACLALGLALAGCATPPPSEGPLSWSGYPLGQPPAPDPSLRQALLARADEEWRFFGRQVVVFRGEEESIPHVGAWEDDDGGYAGRFFVPRRVEDYSPNPGDLICAFRGPFRPPVFDLQVSPEGFRGTNTHCDLVVGKAGQVLEAIGGNVRNSVSKSTLELDGAGRLQAVPRRTWFLILQNRL